MFSKGDKINDRYEIIKLIGEGGMANVYLAYDTILERNVAVKVLRGDLADDEKFVRRFQREAISASSLIHPNIVEMYDVGEDNGNYYIVMEYINGRTLKSLIKKRGALTLPEVIDIMLQLTSAIACAHDSYIIHRDIKPQNVLILEDGRVKITDFGIATALNSNELTQTNSVMGSVHYLPPEQANGSGATIKSDIYSLGILMFELLTGKIPFKGDNAVEIAIKHMKEPIPSVRKINPDIPQSIENVILKACAKNTKNRYDNVKEMYDDIKNALTDEGLQQQRLVYKYPENDLEKTLVVPNLSRMEKNSEVQGDEEMKQKNKKTKKESKLSKAMWITGSICAFLLALICLVVIILPKVTEVEDVIIPDVTGLTVVEAEQILKEKGLNVNTEIKEKKSDSEEGTVIGTEPQIGRTVKKEKEITLVVSIKSDDVIIEDYTGKEYKSIQANLTNKGLNVIVQEKAVSEEEQDKYKENTIIDQSAKKGERLQKGNTIILYYVVYKVEYPDFKEYSVSEVEKFCEKYKVELNIDYVIKDEYEEGTIISQSRTGTVTEGAKLTITVTKKSEVVETPEEGVIEEE